MKVVSFSVIALLALSLAGLGAATAGTRAATSVTKVSTGKTSLGRVVVDGRGMTLYLFERDKHGRSTCNGACASVWTPLLAHGKRVAAGGIRKSLLGVTRRSNGSMQVTYAGHPLYRFIEDTKPGQTRGAGLVEFGGGWDVLSPSGKKIEHGES